MISKKGKGFGGFLGGILKAVLAGLGFTIFKSLPALLKIGRIIKTIATPFTIGVTVFATAIARIADAGSKVIPQVRGKDFQGASEKSINDGIEGLKRALIETAVAFAVGSAAGFGVSRLVRGRTFTEKQAVNILETQKRELRRGKTIRAKKFNRTIRNETQRRLMVDDNFSVNPKAKTFSQLAEVEVATEFKDINPKTGREYTRFDPDIGMAPPDTRQPVQGQLELDVKPKIRRSMKPMEIAIQTTMVKLANEAKARGISEDRIKEIVTRTRKHEIKLFKLLPLSELKERMPDIYEGVIQARKDISAERKAVANQRIDRGMKKSMLSGTGLPGSTVTSDGKLGQKIFRRADGTSTTDAYQEAQKKIFGKTFKKTGEKIGMGASKKGLSKLLFNVGGEAFEQSVKQTIKASVGVIPIIGDLIGFLLDVFLFGQPVGRAAFMAIGSLLGGLIGGVFGLIGGPPGAFVGSILGGIGGDWAARALYETIFGDVDLDLAAGLTENASYDLISDITTNIIQPIET